ncbi:MAG: type I methionyl aminopeptidase [Actinobacteria bacterium]|nr:type I methionyl aminopeptidase [Actinomycetota bacterium]
MSIESRTDLEGLRAAGRVVAEAIRAMRARVRPGVSTAELDRVGARVFAAAGARSAPRQAYDFPGATCISVNDEAAHGIPGRRRLRHGDLVKLDVSAELDGYYADACVSVPVGMVGRAYLDLAAAAEAALGEALAIARTGTPIGQIGRTVESVATARGFSVCRELTGHGIGREIHEWPTVFNCAIPSSSEPLTAGLVITIEPALSAGSGAIVHGEDGWTIKTADGACSAQFEHTLVVTDDLPILLTA